MSRDDSVRWLSVLVIFAALLWVGSLQAQTATRSFGAYQSTYAACSGAGDGSLPAVQSCIAAALHSQTGATCPGSIVSTQNTSSYIEHTMDFMPCVSAVYTIYALWNSCPSGTSPTIGDYSTCTCNTAGHVWDGSQCVAPPDCSATVGKTLSGYISESGNPAVVCFGGCQADIMNASNQWKDASGVQVIAGQWKGTNVACSGQPTASTQAPQEVQCGAGKCYGLVNGVPTCLKCSSTGPGKSWVTLEEQKADGSSSKTTSETTCTGTGCSTTSNTSGKDSSGNPTGSSSATKSEADAKKPGDDQRAFCEENPNSSQCAQLGEAPDPGNLGTQPIGPSSITPVSIPGGGSCPADVPLPHGAVFTWSHACGMAGSIRPVVLAMAWLGAGLIVVGALRNG